MPIPLILVWSLILTNMMQLEERLHNRTVHPAVHLRDARLDDQAIHVRVGLEKWHIISCVVMWNKVG